MIKSLIYSPCDKGVCLKATILAVIGLCSLFGMCLLTLYTKFFDENKILMPIPLSTNCKIDFFGAIFPLFVGLACVAVYLRCGFSKINYVVCFLFSLAIAFFVVQVTSEGLMSPSGLFSIWVSIVVVVLVAVFRKLTKKSIEGFKEIYVASLLIATSCAPLSKIIVDLKNVWGHSDVVIGGNGLADGVLLSAMYSPLAVTFITTLFVFSLLIYHQWKTTRFQNGYHMEKGTQPVS